MPGQQVHVHVCVQYTWKNKGNVLEEIEYMGGVVGSGHAYWTMHTEACYTQVPGLAYMSDVHINQPVHCTSRHLRWRFCSWSTYNTWIKFSTASVKVEFRQRQKQPPTTETAKATIPPPPPGHPQRDNRDKEMYIMYITSASLSNDKAPGLSLTPQFEAFIIGSRGDADR